MRTVTSSVSRITWRHVKRRTIQPAACNCASRARSRLERATGAVVAPAVGLDDQALLGPVEVDLVAEDALVDVRPWQAGGLE